MTVIAHRETAPRLHGSVIPDHSLEDYISVFTYIMPSSIPEIAFSPAGLRQLCTVFPAFPTRLMHPFIHNI